MKKCSKCGDKIDEEEPSGMCLSCGVGTTLRELLDLYSVIILSGTLATSTVLFLMLWKTFFLQIALICTLYLSIRLLISYYQHRKRQKEAQRLRLMFS